MYVETAPQIDEITAEELRCAALALPTDPTKRAEAVAALCQMRIEIERMRVEMEEGESKAETPEERIAPAPTPLARGIDDRPRWLPSMTAVTNAANAWFDTPPAIAVRASGEVCLVRTPRQAARERRHLTWLVLAAIPACLLAEHTGGIATWAYHVSASWNHMWAQTQAGLDQMQKIYQQLHHVGG